MKNYLFDDGLQSGHGDHRDPDGHQRAQEVTELQDIVLHDAEDHDARLVTGVVELWDGIRDKSLENSKKLMNSVLSTLPSSALRELTDLGLVGLSEVWACQHFFSL